jgi:hypothetical protein
VNSDLLKINIMKKLVELSFLLFMTILSFQEIYGQDWKSDSTWTDAKKNIIRYNLSQPLLVGFNNAIIFGYERMLKPNRSISVNLGRMALPEIDDINSDEFEFTKSTGTGGYNFSVDYRFYLGKLNKFSGPRGVYIGPYFSSNHWKRDELWTHERENGEMAEATANSSIKAQMAGFELGYQFVFWDKMTLDLILIGPGIAYYDLSAQAKGNLTQEEKDELQEILLEKIEENFPGLDYTLDEGELDANGTLSTTSFGFRYLIHIGYTF